MRQFKVGAVVVLATMLAGLAPSSASANLIVNPGFEDPITQDGPPFVGSWEGFQGGFAAASNGTVMPRSGLQHLNLLINDGAGNTFTGAFQDVAGLTAGVDWTFSGWHKSLNSSNFLGTEIRIEWRNSVSNSEIARTPNLVPAVTSEYAPFSLTATVPAGADTARLVYAIQSFSGPNFGTVVVDDTSFIPAPGTATMALAAFGLAARRRRRN